MGINPLSLAWLRFPVESSLGRRFPEPAHVYRNPFQRDRDRILHSRAFRRLENKTQVFAPGLSDHFRNRLTHTLEVTQIARTLAAVLELDPDLTEALALVHDIGHPPFAHAGEDELNRQMQSYGGRFDHNMHSLRIVESFETRYALFPGLNLTFEVREGMVKHSRDFQLGEIKELDAYLPGQRPPLEAQLIDLADETAYNSSDLDDAHSAGLFRIEEAAAEVDALREIFEGIEISYPAAQPRIQFLECLGRLVNLLVTGIAEGTNQAVRKAGVQTIAEIRAHPGRLVQYSERASIANRQLKAFLSKRVYYSPILLAERSQAVKRIADLFQFYMQYPGRLPEPHRMQATQAPKHQVVCDYIAGMTDGFCGKLHLELID